MNRTSHPPATIITMSRPPASATDALVASPSPILYNSSNSGLFDSRRGRSASVSSTTSHFDDSQSSATSSSSLSSIEDDEVKNLWSTLPNVNVPLGDVKCIEIPLKSTFGVRPSRRASLASSEQLDPTATPFVPGGTLSGQTTPVKDAMQTDYYYDSKEEKLDHLPPPHSVETEYMHPPGLPIPAHSTPNTAHPDTRLEYPQPLPEEMYQIPVWMTFFNQGTSLEAATNLYLLRLNAEAAVTSVPNWSDEEILYFASQFPSKAYTTVNASEYPIALFAFAVYKAFETTRGDIAAQQFMWGLREHSLHAFMNSWDSNSLKPELHLENGLGSHVFSSLYVARLIGDLFSQGLLSKEHVNSCISKLLETPYSEEHIVALGHLVVQSGAELWMSEDMKLDTKAFKKFMAQLSGASKNVIKIAEKKKTASSLIAENTQAPGYSTGWVAFVRQNWDSWLEYYKDY